ncbi:hypothetical protein NEF87_000039 [Candidatus Lokiarchaeum ossiferum]|uniref:Peptidase M3A/M3B catalytic domain-containing protein n=1 Tax=Candidatus Lokiarchaeum ossiferum TaxID=2951803 RepID=A0ABY6HMN8_9ARCH|nr:hypothetical protein NEF87_000039 [Candidatus Lokiarchaeum sp. B-35]
MLSQKKIETRIKQVANSYQKFLFQTESPKLLRSCQFVYHLIRNIALFRAKIIRNIDILIENVEDSNDKYFLIVFRDLILFYRPRILFVFQRKVKEKIKFPDGTKKSLGETESILLYSSKEKNSQVLDGYIKIKTHHAFDNLSIVNRMHQYAKRAGCSSYMELFLKNSDLNPIKLKNACEVIIEQTMETYRVLLSKLLQFFYRKTIDEANLTDIWNIFAEQFKISDNFEFKSVEKLLFELPMVKFLCPNPKISFQVDYNHKNCLTGIVNDRHQLKIKIQMTKSKESASLNGIFHEYGHAIHLLNVNGENDPLFPLIADSTITETIAFLFESLVLEEKINSKIPMKEENRKEILKFFLLFRWLYRLRKSALHYITRYEILSHPENLNFNSLKQIQVNVKSLYKQFFLIDHPCYDFLDNINENFFLDANYLRAHIMCFKIRSSLVNNFGDDWWEKEETGKFLQEKWFQYGFSLPMIDLIPNLSRDIYSPSKIITAFQSDFIC